MAEPGDRRIVAVVGGLSGQLAAGGIEEPEATVLTFDPQGEGLDRLARWCAEVGASTLHLPALLGRWLPPADHAAQRGSVESVVVHGSVLDPGAVAGIRACFGRQVQVSLEPSPSAEPRLWEVEGRLTEIDGVVDALVVLVDGGSRSVAYVSGLLTPETRRQVDAVLDPVDATLVVLEGGLRSGSGARVIRARTVSPRGRPPGSPPLAPAEGPIQETLVEVFETVTGWSPLGVRDDLFDLAPDAATAAAWVVDELRWRLDVSLRASELIEHRTVEALAPLVAAARAQGTRRPVTARLDPVHRFGPPLFLIPGDRGSVFSLLDAIESVDAPIIGFESPLLTSERSPFSCLEFMALRYLSDLQQVQPRGPYLLGGWGFGGALAFEMARQLRTEGAEVALLAVVDVGPTVLLPGRNRSLPEAFRSSLGDLGRRAQRPDVLPPWERAWDRAAREHGRLLADYRWPVCEELDTVIEIGWSADVGALDPTLGWHQVAPRAEVQVHRLGTPHRPDPDPDSMRAWARVLASALAGLQGPELPTT